MQAAFLNGDASSGPLSNTNYTALDELLGKTDMYSQFLMENLQTWQKEMEKNPEAEADDADAEPEAPKGKAGKKRKAGKAAKGKAAKKQKPLTATQVCQ